MQDDSAASYGCLIFVRMQRVKMALHGEYKIFFSTGLHQTLKVDEPGLFFRTMPTQLACGGGLPPSGRQRLPLLSLRERGLGAACRGYVSRDAHYPGIQIVKVVLGHLLFSDTCCSRTRILSDKSIF